MTRRKLLTSIGSGIVLAGVGGIPMVNAILKQLKDQKTNETQHDRLPVLFIGHGSPMNAIETNDFTDTLKALGQRLERPRAILCLSAHWMTQGLWVTRMAKPKTIHDFYGFPPELHRVQYPAPGSPEVADLVRASFQEPEMSVQADEGEWGLDHGTWSVLRHLYPKADIPVLQLSLFITQPGAFHYRLGEQLRVLRDQGVLIVGSGNIVHNLRQLSWESDAKPYDWALEFDEWVKQKILARDFHSLANQFKESFAGRLSVPTPDHYYPLLSILGAADSSDEITFPYEGMQNGAISMRAVGIGLKG